MNISKLELENFKCFQNLQLDFGKLTILTGANSSGKSSVIYSLLSALQSDSFPMQYSINGKYINLGDFEDISFLRRKANKIKISFTINDNDSSTRIETTWAYDKIKKQPTFYSLAANGSHYGMSVFPHEHRLLVRFTYIKSNNSEKELEESYRLHYNLSKFLGESIAHKFPESKEDKDNPFDLQKLERQFKRNEKRISFYIDNIEQLSETIKERGSFIFDESFKDLLKKIQWANDAINYIGSFRLNPRKLNYEIAQANLKVGINGEKYEDQILDWEYRKSPKFQELINILKKLKLLDDIKTNRISGGNYEVKIKTHKQSVFSSLTDVGFGISQFLPIIVADLQLPDESMLFLSQPEIHLHPSIQSDFANYIADQIQTREKNYVIETHSEYFLNKVRLLIVKKILKKEDVCIYYFGKTGNNVKTYKLEFTESGEIKNAPKEFFTTYMTDVMDIALNA